MTNTTNTERLADELQSAVQTYPQMSEDEPGGYCSAQDELMDRAVVELRRLSAALAETEGQAVPTKMQIPPAPIDMTEVCFAEGWNAACDAFFGGLPPPEPLVITVYTTAAPAVAEPLTSCRAGSDGDCVHPQCPQLRDGEPKASGRHCPLDVGTDREVW